MGHRFRGSIVAEHSMTDIPSPVIASFCLCEIRRDLIITMQIKLRSLFSMPESDLRLIRRRIEFITPSEVRDLPSRLRGIYVLYKKRRKVRPNGKPCFDVVYVGMARNGVKGRLWEHLRKKKDLWSHCSVFEV